MGAGALSSVASFTYSGAQAPYDEDYPDVLTAPSGSQVVLQYGNGMGAAAGIPGSACLVGFPLELIDSAADRRAVVTALLSFVGGP